MGSVNGEVRGGGNGYEGRRERREQDEGEVTSGGELYN